MATQRLQKPNCNFFNLADPVAHVGQAFREHLLRYALSSIVLPSTTDDDTTGDKSARDALSYLHMLNECASTSEKHMNMSSAVDDDQVAKWWLAVGMVAVYWLQGEDEAAERFYSTIESVPKSLWNAEYVDVNCGTNNNLYLTTRPFQPLD